MQNADSEAWSDKNSNENIRQPFNIKIGNATLYMYFTLMVYVKFLWHAELYPIVANFTLSSDTEFCINRSQLSQNADENGFQPKRARQR